MAEDDLEFRMGIEQARPHQAQRMNRGLLSERPGRAHQPGMAFIDRAVFRQRIARVQVERAVRSVRPGPERPVLRQVVIDRPLAVADLREAVDQRATEAERLDAALELLDREIRILHRQRGKRLKPRRTFCDLLGEEIIGADRNLVGARDVGNGLNRRRVQRKDHHLDAVPVHLRQPLVLDVQQTILQFRPVGVRAQNPPNPSACPGWRNVPLVRSCPACRPR